MGMINLKQAIKDFLPNISQNPDWEDSKNHITLLHMATIVYCNEKSYSGEDRKLAREVINSLIEYGADPTHKSGHGVKKLAISPLEIAQWNNEELAEFFINSQLEDKPATEAVAFENKLTDLLKKAGNKLMDNKVTNKAGKILGKVADIKNSKYNGELKKDLEKAKEKSGEILDERGSKADPETVNQEKSNLDKLPPELVKKDKGLAMNIASKMAKDSNLSHKLLMATNHLCTSVGIEDNPNELELKKNLHIVFLLDSNFGEKLCETLSKYRAGGLGKSVEKGNISVPVALSQMKIIAYFLDQKLDVKRLRNSSSQWKSLKSMTKEVRDLEVSGDGILGLNQDKQTMARIMTGADFKRSYFPGCSKKEIVEWVKKQTSSKFEEVLAALLKKDPKTWEDTVKNGEVL